MLKNDKQSIQSVTCGVRMATLKECQRNAVVKMLHYNNPSYNAKSAKSTSSRNTNEGPVWKGIVFSFVLNSLLFQFQTPLFKENDWNQKDIEGILK